MAKQNEDTDSRSSACSAEDCNRPCRVQGRFQKYPASAIPWWLAEIAYEEYARRYGNLQTLERINERGGFGREELVSLIRREKP